MAAGSNRTRDNVVDKKRLEDYPIGTKAMAINGGYWVKVKRGWKWFNGSTFPRPGADVYKFVEPGSQSQ